MSKCVNIGPFIIAVNEVENGCEDDVGVFQGVAARMFVQAGCGLSMDEW